MNCELQDLGDWFRFELLESLLFNSQFITLASQLPSNFMNIVRFALPIMLLLILTGCTSTERAAQNEAVSVARVMAINSSSALASGKEREGRLMVRSIADAPDVAFALLFDRENNLFADF